MSREGEVESKERESRDRSREPELRVYWGSWVESYDKGWVLETSRVILLFQESGVQSEELRAKSLKL